MVRTNKIVCVKVRHLTVFKMSTEYRAVVIRAFATELLTLTLAQCEDVNLAEELRGCDRLETLKLLLDGSVVADPSPAVADHLEAPAAWTAPSAFLPSLKRLESDICMRTFSSLQERTSLVELSVDCCHVRDWTPSRVLNLWPRVQQLHIRRAHGTLTMAAAERLFPLLKKLQSLHLPQSMLVKKSEGAASFKLKDLLAGQKTALSFQSSYSPTCSLLGGANLQEMWEASENDSDADESSELDIHNRHIQGYIDFASGDVDLPWDGDDIYSDFDDSDDDENDYDEYDVYDDDLDLE